MGVNSVTLVGRAGRDPEVRYFESGSMVANLTMAVNRRSRDDEPDWFNLEIWGKQAQVAADYVKKGALLGIIGSFKLDRWTDRSSGEERSKPVIRVDRPRTSRLEARQPRVGRQLRRTSLRRRHPLLSP
jgi:single-strand DNA-binding protein